MKRPKQFPPFFAGLHLFALALVVALGCSLPANAAGDLLVTPTRVLFDGKKRTVAVTLVNTGKEPATYRISFLNQRMTETGAFEEIKNPGPDDHLAEGVVRFTPKQVILAPGIAQVVRLQLHKTSDLPDGEYRSHLLFRAIPPIISDVQDPHAKTLSISLIPVFGVSIPVIVRQGQLSASVNFSDLKISRGKGQNEPPVLSLRLNRGGNRSIYGDLNVDFLPVDGEKTTVQRITGLAVYSPNSSRVVKISLQAKNHSKGRLLVTFKETGDPSAAVPQANSDAVEAATELPLDLLP